MRANRGDIKERCAQGRFKPTDNDEFDWVMESSASLVSGQSSGRAGQERDRYQHAPGPDQRSTERGKDSKVFSISNAHVHERRENRMRANLRRGRECVLSMASSIACQSSGGVQGRQRACRTRRDSRAGSSDLGVPRATVVGLQNDRYTVATAPLVEAASEWPVTTCFPTPASALQALISPGRFSSTRSRRTPGLFG